MLTPFTKLCKHFAAMKPAIFNNPAFSAVDPTFAGFGPAGLFFSSTTKGGDTTKYARLLALLEIPLQNTPLGCDIRLVIGTLKGCVGGTPNRPLKPTFRPVQSKNSSLAQGPNPKSYDLATFSRSSDTLLGSGGISSGLEESRNARPTYSTQSVEARQPDELRRRINPRSTTTPPHEKTENNVYSQSTANERDSGLLVGSSQTHPKTEVAAPVLCLSGRPEPLGYPGKVSQELGVNRPLVVHRVYWADIATEEQAEWYQPFYFEVAA